MPNAWLEHVKKHRETHGGSYKDALKNARATYQKKEAGWIMPVLDLAYRRYKKREVGVLPPPVRKFLREKGDTVIKSLVLVRTPLSKGSERAMNILSFGQFKKALDELGYDTIFHLGLLINGIYVLEKNEVVKLARNTDYLEDKSEIMEVNLPPRRRITIQQLVDNTRRAITPQQLTEYDAKTNNCQNFVNNVLKANRLDSPATRRFTTQNARAIFKNLPQATEGLTGFLTDTGAKLNRFVHGEGKLANEPR